MKSEYVCNHKEHEFCVRLYSPFQYTAQVQGIDSIEHNMPSFIVQTLRQMIERRGFQIEDGGVLRLNLSPTDAARAWEIEDGEEWGEWAAEEEQDLPGENVERHDAEVSEMKSEDEAARHPTRSCKSPSRDRPNCRVRKEEPSSLCGARSQHGECRSRSRREDSRGRLPLRRHYPSQRSRSTSTRRRNSRRGRSHDSRRDNYRSEKQCTCPPPSRPPPPPRRRSRTNKKKDHRHKTHRH